MCGIAGFCNFNYDYVKEFEKTRKILVEMRSSIAHRGNDQNGEFINTHIGLSHARLSIRDIALGAQPMTRKICGYTYTIVYNGEIYNAEEIKSDLKNKYNFETTSDTEVILFAYINYGEEFVKKLNGIYSFGIWDGKNEKLLLYRDRVGVKPLFYTITEGGMVFASEIKALFCYSGIKAIIDINGLQEIFGIGPARTAGNGIFKNINEVKAGHFLSFTRYGLNDIQYWKLQSHEHTDNYSQTVEKVSYLVRDAVTRQLVSDVPVCSFLSGGIDSSIVTAIASDYFKQHGSRLNTFSFDFAGNDEYFKANSFQPERDRPFVNIMLKNTDVNHKYLECSNEKLAELLNSAVDAKDLPGMVDIDASLLYFCKLVKQDNKVALTGECADEVFGGYPWFYREELFNKDGFPWSDCFEVRESLLDSKLIEKLQLKEYSHYRYEESLAEVPYLFGEKGIEKRRREISYLNLSWFMSTLLDRMDRMSMYSGLEARVPFADHRIIEYMWNVPWDMKYKNGVTKGLLRDAFSDLLPMELLTRKKSPYPKTYNPCYERILLNRIKEIFESENEPISSLLNRNNVKEFIETIGEYSKPWFGQLMAGPQLMAYIIQINYWLKKYDIVLEL